MGDISTVISVDVTGTGDLDALATAAERAAAALDSLQKSADEGLNFSGAAGAGADKMVAAYEAGFAKIQEGWDKLQASMAKAGDMGGGADAAAASLGKISDAEKAAADQADVMAASVGKADDTLKGLGDTGVASAAGLGKLSDAQKSVSETAAGLKDTSAGVSDGLKVQADQTAALTALQADMADSQKALTALSAEHAAVMADSSARIAAGQRLNTVAAKDASDEAIASQAAQSKAATQAAADTEASAGKYHMLALGAAAAVAYGVDLAAKLQTSVARLYTSAGESQANLPMITAGILKLSGQTDQSQADLATGAYWDESAGFHGADALAVLKAGAQGAKAEGADVGTTENALTTVLNDYFGGPQKSSATQGKMATTAMNEIIGAVGMGKMTLQGLSSALPQVLPTAKTAGLSLPQVLGTLATMTAGGTTAENAAQETRYTISHLQGPSGVQAAEMQMLGLDPNKLSKDLGKEGLTGTIAEVDDAIKSHTKSGMVQLDTMNHSALAMQSANQEIQALPQNLQGAAKQYLAGTMGSPQWNALTSAFKSTLPVGEANLLRQFGDQVNTARGFSALEKEGLGNRQTVAKALSEIFGGAPGAQVAQMVGGSHLGTLNDDVSTLSQRAQSTGTNIRGWSAVQGQLNFQIGSFVKQLQAVATETGQAALPELTTAMHGLSDVTGFLASNPGLTKDLTIGGGVLGAAAIAPKLANVGATALSSVGKVAETLHIPGLDKLAGLGQGSGLAGAATGLSGAAGELSGAAGELSGAAGKLADGGGLPGGGPVTGAKNAGEEAGEDAGEAGGAVGAGGFLKGAGALSEAAGPAAWGLTLGMIIKGVGDQLSPAGTQAGKYNRALQKSPATNDSSLMPDIFGGYEGKAMSMFGLPVGNAIDDAINGIRTPEAASSQSAFQSRFGISAPGSAAPAAPRAAAVSPEFTNTLAQAMGKPAKVPAPDLSALSAAKGQAAGDMAGITAAIAQAMGKPVKVAPPDLSAFAAAKGAAAADGASVSAGFAAGILSGEGAAVGAASSVASAAASAMHVTLKISSPSRVGLEIGSNFGNSVATGITGSKTAVDTAAASIGSDSVTSLIQGLEGGQDDLQAATSAIAGAAANPDAVTSIQQTIATLTADIPAGQDTGLVKWLGKQQTKLSALANQQGALEAEISGASQLATSAISGASITTAATYTPALAASGPQAAQSIVTGMQAQLADTKAFASSLTALQKMGLNATDLSQLAQAGTATGLPLAEGIQQGGKSAVSQLNATEKQIVSASQQIGTVGGVAAYQASQQVGQGLATGLKDALKQVDKEMAAEANAVIARVDKALGGKTSSSSSSAPGTAASSSTAAGSAASTSGTAAAAASGGLGKLGSAGGSAASGLESVASAAGSAAGALGRISSALAPLLAASQPPAGGGRAASGGGYSGYAGSGGGGGGIVIHHTTHVTVQGSVTAQQDLASALQGTFLEQADRNLQTGLQLRGRGA